MNIGERMKQIREEKGLTQNEVAQRAGVTAASLSRWENEEREPTFQNVQRIAQALGVTMAEMVKEPEKPKEGFRKIIDGKLYDTGKCELIYKFRRKYKDPIPFIKEFVSVSWEDAQFLKTEKGNYLFFCPARKELQIVSEKEVKETIRQLSADSYIRIFGEVEEG